MNGRGALNGRRGIGERKTTSSQSETEKGQDATEKEVPRHHDQAFWPVAFVCFHAVGVAPAKRSDAKSERQSPTLRVCHIA